MQELYTAPGDTVLHGQYMNRMNKDMNNVKFNYDWSVSLPSRMSDAKDLPRRVIAQAGGNDLAWNSSPETIFEGLKAVWEIPLKAGAKVMWVLSTR